MTATVLDMFCGAGGSSLGAEAAGMKLIAAANHWQTAIDVHQTHFPDAMHDVADLREADPRRYPWANVLLASPECTNHSQARGVSRKRQDPSLWDAPDPAAERSRATMWTVPHFAEQLRFDAIVVENVVEATKWVGWRAWHVAMEDLGYEHRVLSHNSMHHQVPQSRDRIYVVFWRRGLRPDLEMELSAWCARCDAARTVRQGFKNGRRVGRYRQQWEWTCTVCGTGCEPGTRPAADIIDWGLDCPRIGDRRRPLAPATRARIIAGLRRYGWAPIVTSGAGNGFERTPGNRARPVHTEPMPTQTCSASHALATPPDGFFVQPHHSGADGSRVRGLDDPLWTVTASDDRAALVVHLRGTEPGQVRGSATSIDDPIRTVSAGGIHHGLLMRNNGGGAEMVTPTDEPARTLTSKGHQSLLVPYYGRGQAQPTDRPLPTVRTRDAHALVDVEALVDDCGFRMLEPHEIAAAMSFPDGYIPSTLTKRDRVKLAGNAVTPPVMQWITGRLLQALEGAA
jgi:DNA (cytosine-5)-methyltransferase 1